MKNLKVLYKRSRFRKGRKVGLLVYICTFTIALKTFYTCVGYVKKAE